jgi:ADP-ribose pyrophosphatase YjhB (NUDIX family)
MKYCSECGVPITRQWVADEGRERYVCAACGVTHYQNPRVLVSCIVCWRDKVLMCRRSQEPARGQWIIPSGFLECGESLEEGAARETFEEAGVIVDPSRLELCSIMNMTVIEQVAITFRTAVDAKPDVFPGPECFEVAFMSEEEIPASQFAWREAMGSEPRQFFDELRSGDFSIRLISIASKHGAAFKSRRYKIGSPIGENKI